MLPFLGALFFYGGLIMALGVLESSRLIFASGASSRWLLPLLATQLPETLGLVLPMAAVLGGLMGSQQLSESSELVASQGLGVGARSILKPWLILSLVFLVLATLNTHLLVPKFNRLERQFRSQMVEEAKTRILRPGSAPVTLEAKRNGALWLDASGEVHLMEVNEQSVQHLIAGSMAWSQVENRDHGLEMNVQLNDIKGCGINRKDEKIHFIKQQSLILNLPLEDKRALITPTALRHQDTSMLFASTDPEAKIELALRFSLPFAIGALLLLGIAMGLGHPRFQKGGAILKSLGIVIAYYAVVEVTKAQVSNGKVAFAWLIVALPWIFLMLAFYLLVRKLHPHHSNSALQRQKSRWIRRIQGTERAIHRRQELRYKKFKFNIFNRWTQKLFWKNWGAAMGTFLTLSLLMEFVGMASHLSKNNIGVGVFLQYWVWNLPPFLVIVLPISFVFGGVLALSEAAVSREWVAMRAGGVSLVQWIRSGITAWGSVVLLMLILQVYLAPLAFSHRDRLYRFIKQRRPASSQLKPWLHLGAKEMHWHLDGQTRWGFPLKHPGEGPLLLKWEMGARDSKTVHWNDLNWRQGPSSVELFPNAALRETENASSASTPALYRWHQWAPDPEREALLWERLLGALACPLLLWAALPFAFPTPRGGRGSALGLTLVISLGFLGLQAIFSGAAKAGEIPALWGVLAPLLVLGAFGLLNLHRLRT